MARRRHADDYLFLYGLKRVTMDDLPTMLPWSKCKIIDRSTERKLGTMSVSDLLRKFG